MESSRGGGDYFLPAGVPSVFLVFVFSTKRSAGRSGIPCTRKCGVDWCGDGWMSEGPDGKIRGVPNSLHPLHGKIL